MLSSIKQYFTFDEGSKKRYLILAERLGIGTAFIKEIVRRYKTFGFGAKRQLEFITDFSSWLSDGSSPKDACLSIVNSGRAQGKDTAEVKVATSIYQALKDGKSVDVGMEDWFDKEVITIFKVGQEAGVLPEVVASYLKDINEIAAIKKEYVVALIKPMIYTFVVLVLMVVIGKYGMPIALEGQSLASYPPQFQTLYSVSTTVAQIYPYIIAAIFGVVMLYRYLRDNYSGTYRDAMNKVIPFSINKAFTAMTLLKMLAIMLKANKGLYKSCELLRKESTPYVQTHYQQIMKNCAEIDGTAAELLDTGLLTPRLYERLANASNISGDKAKQEAISIAGRRSGEEAAKSLIVTKRYVVALSWAVTAGLLIVLLNGAIAYMANLSSF